MPKKKVRQKPGPKPKYGSKGMDATVGVTASNKRTQRIEFRVSPTEYAVFARAARELDTTVSKMARDYLWRAVHEWQRDHPPKLFTRIPKQP